MSDKVPMTVHGKEMLEKELKRLLTQERPSIIKAIEEARSHGDISENADYDAAKERQAFNESRIAEIQGKLASAEVIDLDMIQSDRVVFGATVSLEDVEEGNKLKYQIVGVDEADVKSGKISILSPIARAMIGKKLGDIIEVQSPSGVKEYEILDFYFKK